jgi:hypothetical protein
MHSNIPRIASACYWWSSISLRIAHKELDPNEVTDEIGISPSVSFAPGKSQVHHQDCKSAGYWCGEKKVDFPIRPPELILWMEDVVEDHEIFLNKLLMSGANVNIYLAIHVDVASIGFDLPSTPTLNRLGIPMGIEFFGR